MFANEHSAIIAGLAPLDDEARQFFESGPAGPAPAQLQDMDTSTDPATGKVEQYLGASHICTGRNAR